MPLSISQIHEHMRVIAADGKQVGTVDRVEGDRIKLTRDGPGGHGEHHYIDLDQVDEIRGEEVCLATAAKPRLH